MALIVEDGTGLENANSYDTIANIEAYLTARGITLSGTTTEKEQRAIKATQWIDNRYINRFTGYQATSYQALLWPRIGAYNNKTWPIPSNEIPTRLKNAQAEAMVLLQDGTDLTPEITTGVKRLKEKVDVLEADTEYAHPTDINNQQTTYLTVENELRPLLAGKGVQIFRA